MRVQIHMLKPLTDFLSIDEELVIEVEDGATVHDLIEKLVKLYGEKLKEIVLDPVKGRLKILVFVDGKYGELKTKLGNGSKVIFMTPYAGG